MQRTWDAILNTPIDLDDVVVAEVVWSASKATLSGAAVLLVATLLGLVQSWLALWIVPLALIAGLTFASLGLIMTAVSPSYDFFMYYFTLVITPMMLVSGVFFPIEQLPPALQAVSQVLPLTHFVVMIRGIVLRGAALWEFWPQLAKLATFFTVMLTIAVLRFRKRLD